MILYKIPQARPASGNRRPARGEVKGSRIISVTHWYDTTHRKQSGRVATYRVQPASQQNVMASGESGER
jgi:hypothetical protein